MAYKSVVLYHNNKQFSGDLGRTSALLIAPTVLFTFYNLTHFLKKKNLDKFSKFFELSGVRIHGSWEQMNRNKGNNGDSVHFNSYSSPWIWGGDASAIHTTFQRTQYKEIIDLLRKELSGKTWRYLNDPELDRHIFLLCICNAKKGEYLTTLKWNAMF